MRTEAAGRSVFHPRTADGVWGAAGFFSPPVCRARNVAASMVLKKSWRAGAVSVWGDCGAALWGAPSRSRQSSTVWYTASNTSRSRANFTWVLAGWTFTSTAVTGSVTQSTQPGNLPFMIWLR